MRYLLLAIVTVLCVSALPAQVNFRLNFNVDKQPVWGPTGYDHVEYYYLPDIETYYNVPQHMFIYRERGRWVSRSRLPYRYRNFDFYNSYKVVVNDPRPYRNHRMYRDRYATYRGRHDQDLIRDSRDSRYYVNKDHPEHDNWMRRQRQDNGDGRGRDEGSRYNDERDAQDEQSNYDNSYDRGRNDGDRRDGSGSVSGTGALNGSVGVDIASQPIWGPTGYDRAVYYYIPDINVYYSLAEHQYIYWEGSEWNHAASLPSSYRGFDPYHSYKVVINEDRPYLNNESHRDKYRTFKGMRDQPVIRDSHDRKYFVNKDHPEHDNWLKDQRR
ncbi:MAG TPA: hypothetical protein VL633_12775 [Bacteroidota bacterium]|jgi:hypothetical protein|nr:hypothetical protein [Bacteroidota bacterium]